MKNFLLKSGFMSLAFAGIVISGCRNPQTSDPSMVMGKPGLTPVVQSGRTLADLSILKNSRENLNVYIDSFTIAETSERYRFATEGVVRQKPITLGNNIVIGDEKGYVYKISNLGELVWKVKLSEPDTSLAKCGFQGSGTIGDGMILMASGEGELLGISPDSGLVVWKKKILESGNQIFCGDIIYYDGLAYIGIQPISNNKDRGDSIKTGSRSNYNKILAFDPMSGDLIWEKILNFPPGNMELTESFAIDPKAKMLYYTANHSYDSLSVEIVAGALDLKSGETTWISNFPIGGKGTNASSPTLFEKSQNGKTLPLMQSIVNTGKVLIWERNKGTYLNSDWSLNNGIASDSTEVLKDESDITFINKTTSYRVGGYTFVSADNGKVVCQSNENQKVEWESEILGNITSPLWYNNGYIYISVINEIDLMPELIVFQLGILEEPYFIRVFED